MFENQQTWAPPRPQKSYLRLRLGFVCLSLVVCGAIIWDTFTMGLWTTAVETSPMVDSSDIIISEYAKVTQQNPDIYYKPSSKISGKASKEVGESLTANNGAPTPSQTTKLGSSTILPHAVVIENPEARLFTTEKEQSALPDKQNLKVKEKANDLATLITSTLTTKQPLPSDGPNPNVNPNDNSTTVLYTSVKKSCPLIPPKLVGRLAIDKTPMDLSELEGRHPELLPGGLWRPQTCESRNKVAIVLPYRDRMEHLLSFANHMHPFLQRQQLDYGIFVVEQAGTTKFNRALLFNIGFVEAHKIQDYDCFFFHDVDLLPEDDRNMYSCPEQPRHMSVAIDTMNYKLPYKTLFGGVSALSTEDFKTVNGFSNSYWGWGGEDDDMYNRVDHHSLGLTRYPADIARYTMLTHESAVPNPIRYDVLYSGSKRFKTDGLNSLEYKLIQVDAGKLYTRILVEVQEPFL